MIAGAILAGLVTAGILAWAFGRARGKTSTDSVFTKKWGRDE